MKRAFRGAAVAIAFMLLISAVPGLSHQHVHAYNIPISPGDAYEAPCPNCGAYSARVESLTAQPTCTAPGSGTIFCICGLEAYPVSFPALGHSYSSFLVNGATCTTSGTRAYSCSRCGDSYTETIPATGHSYTSAVTSEATCTTSGVRTYTCSACNDQYTETIAATGHSYSKVVTKEATCTARGEITHTCSSCGNKYSETVKALGHNYKMAVTKEATCEEDGEETYTCSRCKDSYTSVISAFGHSYEYEETLPTCTEPGHKKGVCSTCGGETDELIPALGHTMGLPVIVKEATCTEDGLLESTCSVCGEKKSEAIPMTGHTYPEEWTIETEATLFKDGLMSKTCPDCGEKIEEPVPKKLTWPVVAAIVAGTGAIAGGLWFFLRRKGFLVGRWIPDAAAKGVFKPSYEARIVVTDIKGEFLDLLKGQSYLQVIGCESEEMAAAIEENGPHIIISEADDRESLSKALGYLKDGTAECALGLILAPELTDSLGEIKVLKGEGYRINHVPKDTNKYETLVKLILPVLKPDIDSDETLDSFGQIADLLGIPGISSVINVYVSGRDIKATMEEGELGAVEKATIIGDIASILGLDTVESIAGLVVDADSIKTALDEEAGAYEKKEGRAAVKDIAEVVSDLL